MIRMICLLLVVYSLVSCTNREPIAIVNCDSDWKKIGYDAARAGKAVRKIDDYIQVCGKKAEVGKSAYLDGYARGIIEFCNKDNGFAIGAKGLDMPQVCPYELRSEFAKGHELGLKQHRINMDDWKDMVEKSVRENSPSVSNDSVLTDQKEKMGR